jgi:nitronate monooxygenase
MRRALNAFPFPALAERVWQRYFVQVGKDATASYKAVPPHSKNNPRDLLELCIAGNFAEVFLAREGHSNAVGINYLEKIQAALLPAIYGAMLAGVDYVLMGAGIPLKIPGVLDRFVEHQSAEYSLHVIGAVEGDDTTIHFDPREFAEVELAPLKKPRFLPIISSNTLASTLLKKANGKVDGFVVETRIAGGHNAPPRGKLQLSDSGEPVYGDRDAIDLGKLRDLGVPFWLAGGYGTPEKVREALEQGATGVQIGTAFEFAAESGLRDDYKHELLAKAIAGEAHVFTDPLASPTGFPFKVARLEGTGSEPEVYATRPRICDLGFLREAYRAPDGSVGYRCAAEPLSVYVAKGGHTADTEGRKCICNALLANVGFPQIRNGKRVENGIVTAGDEINSITRFLRPGRSEYTVKDVLETLMSGCDVTVDRNAKAALSHELSLTLA